MTDHPRLFRPMPADFEQAYRQFHGHSLVTLALYLTEHFTAHRRAPRMPRSAKQITQIAADPVRILIGHPSDDVTSR